MITDVISSLWLNWFLYYSCDKFTKSLKDTETIYPIYLMLPTQSKYKFIDSNDSKQRKVDFIVKFRSTVGVDFYLLLRIFLCCWEWSENLKELGSNGFSQIYILQRCYILTSALC